MLSLALQESTEEIHKQAEKKMISELKQIQSPSNYARLLNWMYGFYQPMEDKISAWLTENVFPDMEKRRRAANILRDIQAIGQTLPYPDICRDLPTINSFAEALGAMYVLEGSTLGGRVIAKMLSRQLGSTDGLSFFNAYGMETGGMWLTFKSFLDRPFLEDERRQILSTAKDTFLKFKTWIDQHELHAQL
jgi:heme oxygenase